MAHMVEKMAFFGATPWHGLGVRLNEADTYDLDSCRVKAGLDWDVELAPLFTADEQQAVTHKAVRRATDRKVLGVVGPRYHPLQNREAFDWFRPFLESREAALHTAGSLRGGSRVWILAKLNRDPLVIVPGDEVEKYVLLSHGHDGSLAVRAGFSPIRVLCANTLAMAHGDNASKLIRIRHSKSVVENLNNIREVMDLANQQFEATAEQYRRLAHKHVNQADVRKYIKKLLDVKEGEDLSTKMKNTIERIVGMTESGRGNDLTNVRGTAWGMMNGFNEWLAYSRGNSQDTRLDSLWFGDGANLNKKALELALEMAV